MHTWPMLVASPETTTPKRPASEKLSKKVWAEAPVAATAAPIWLTGVPHLTLASLPAARWSTQAAIASCGLLKPGPSTPMATVAALPAASWRSSPPKYWDLDRGPEGKLA